MCPFSSITLPKFAPNITMISWVHTAWSALILVGEQHAGPVHPRKCTDRSSSPITIPSQRLFPIASHNAVTCLKQGFRSVCGESRQKSCTMICQLDKLVWTMFWHNTSEWNIHKPTDFKCLLISENTFSNHLQIWQACKFQWSCLYECNAGMFHDYKLLIYYIAVILREVDKADQNEKKNDALSILDPSGTSQSVDSTLRDTSQQYYCVSKQ